ncbi:MAG: hypothetical protein ACRD28_05850 [Acidobacteriaceae bacterium]
MATNTTQFTDYPVIPARRFFSWSGIFAGTFVFLAIEGTFGILGTSIFGGTGIGIQIWMIILSIIALYWAGKTSSKLLIRDRNLGMYHGLTTFGMSIFATVLIVEMTLGGALGLTTARFGSLAGYITSGGEYWLFVAFVLSMIAAAIGGMHGVATTTTVATASQERTTTTRNIA